MLLKNTGRLPVTVMEVVTEPAGYAHFPRLQPPLAAEETAAKAAKTTLLLQPGEVRELPGKITATALHALMPRAAVAAADSNETGGQPPAPIQPEPATPAEGQRESLRISCRIITSPLLDLPACEFEVLPLPEFELLTPTLQLFDQLPANSPILRCSSGGRIRLRRGKAAIRDLACDLPAIKLVPEGLHSLPGQLEAGRDNGTLAFQVEVTREFIAPYLQSGQPVLAALKLVCSNPPGTFAPFNSPLRILPHPIPRLEFPGLVRHRVEERLQCRTWALAGRSRRLALQVRNAGTLPIDIIAITPAPSLEAVVALHRPAVPIRLMPRQIETIHFLLSPAPSPSATMFAGELAFRYHAGTPATYLTRLPMQIEVRVPQPYRGVAALDFGTSHTCLAVAERDEQAASPPHLLRVNGEAFVPSVILYHGIDAEGQRRYDIGQAALAASAGVEAIMQVIHDVKKHLGVEQDREILLRESGATVMLPAQTIVVDFLKRLIYEAENDLAEELYRRRSQRGEAGDFGACLLQNMLVAHPATFTAAQKNALRQALALAGVMLTDDSWLQPSPVIAGFEGLLARVNQWKTEAGAPPATPQRRHVLTYDLGAGNTSMALTCLELYPEAGRTLVASSAIKLNLKTVSVDGDETFGGDTITIALAKYLMEQAVAQLEQRLPAPVVVPLWNRPFELPQMKIEKAGYLNWRRLLRRAEQLKCSLAELTSEQSCTLRHMTLQVVSAGQMLAATVSNLAVTAGWLENLVAASLEMHVLQLQQMVHKAGLESPDILRLTGKSTLLPFVRSRMARIFPAERCKVVYSLDGKPARSLLPINGLKSTTAVGGAFYLRHLTRGGWIEAGRESEPRRTGVRIGLGLRAGDELRFWEVISKEDLLDTEYIVRAFGLTRDTLISFYASEKEGPLHLPDDAKLLASCRLDFNPPLPGDMRDQELLRLVCTGKLRLKLTATHELHVLLQARGREHVIYLRL
ncbi:MAG: hypothetical protein ONB48_01990 [candidate division KSB1 bacterium]|nr:hypothetical protein [candidate division KSB1 bacterium]MDZ7272550.1 hypothetical protein [candidate division KSB1 bacterium]MDZ7284427.1 hypothetical protein [candidate division KSB1 bacterium]MDZ7297177.1 hypothetical protein [candidate division KSB1 bacterium]MDZ7306684.1 hypothetical protein [candidate division KSB1 bacterium]